MQQVQVPFACSYRIGRLPKGNLPINQLNLIMFKMCIKYFDRLSVNNLTIIIFSILSGFFFIIPRISLCQPLKNEFKIDGNISGKNQGFVYLKYYSNITKKRVDDSCKIVDGSFSFKGKISEPAFAFIKLSSNSRMDYETILAFIEPTRMNIKLLAKPFSFISFLGSKTNIRYNFLDNNKKILFQKYEDKLNEFAGERDDKKRDILKTEILPYYEQMKQLDLEYFALNPNCFVTGFLLQSYYSRLSIDTLSMYYQKMDVYLKESIYGVQLYEAIQKRKENLPGQFAPDFKALSFNDDIITLSQFKGRYVLLDFWAHWCVPCRKSFPRLIQMYDKYHDKGLEVIGVADDDFSKDLWRKAIEKDGISIWYNVLRGLERGNDGSTIATNSINNKYFVQVLPTKILIDPKGIIIAVYKGSDTDEKLEKKLIEIFDHRKL